jgi:sphingolipid 4-desaturase/C4-monooxygenase
MPEISIRLGQGTAPRENVPSPQLRRHIQQRRAILAAHPHAAALAGADRRGAVAAALLLVVHWTVCWWVAQTDVVVVFLVAFLFGQVLIHSAGALLHETAHRLVFRDRRAKLCFDLLLETIMTTFSLQLTYQHEHVSLHHPFLGNYERDYEHEDNCRVLARRAFRHDHPLVEKFMVAGQLLVHLLPLGFFISDRIFLPIYESATGRATRDPRRHLGSTEPSTAERALFVAVSAATLIFLLFAFGWLAALYQIWSISLFRGKAGVTNLGQSLSEHPGDDEVNPTRSRYGWINWILFNTGYHHEHHVFPNVAWSRLPKLTAIAPEIFDRADPLSYFRRWWDHVRSGFSPPRRNPFQDGRDPERCRNDARRAA